MRFCHLQAEGNLGALFELLDSFIAQGIHFPHCVNKRVLAVSWFYDLHTLLYVT